MWQNPSCYNHLTGGIVYSFTSTLTTNWNRHKVGIKGVIPVNRQFFIDGNRMTDSEARGGK